MGAIEHHPLLSDPDLYRCLVKYARRYTGGDEERARDVTHDAYLRVLARALADFHAGYLYAAVHNRAVDLLKREKHQAREYVVEPYTPTHGQAHAAMVGPAGNTEAEALTRLEVAELVSGLMARRDGRMLLLYAMGWRYGDIGALRGMTVDAVRQGIHRARQRLAVVA